MVVKHTDFIAEVIATSTFQVFSYAINPGVAATFPWLANTAPNYETYRFRSLRFHFETDVAATVSGYTAFAIEYDNNDSAPTTLPEFMTINGATKKSSWQEDGISSKPSASFSSGGRDSKKFVRIGDFPLAGPDPNLYDAGKFYFVFVVASGVAARGTLHATYEVEFFTPQPRITLPVSSNAGTTVFELKSDSNAGQATTVNVVPFANVAPVLNDLGLSPMASNGTLSFRDVGVYSLGYNLVGGAAGNAVPYVTSAIVDTIEPSPTTGFPITTADVAPASSSFVTSSNLNLLQLMAAYSETLIFITDVVTQFAIIRGTFRAGSSAIMTLTRGTSLFVTKIKSIVNPKTFGQQFDMLGFPRLLPAPLPLLPPLSLSSPQAVLPEEEKQLSTSL